MVLAALNSSARAQSSVNLAWDPSTGSGIAGYKLYRGTVSGVYTSWENVGNVTTKSVSGLTAGVTYFFAVTAYNTNNLDSLFSNEINYLVPTGTNLPTITLTAPSNGASYGAPATITLAASVTANGHAIIKVQFYNGAALLGEDLVAPYSMSWSNVSAGGYSVSARAVYDAGSTVASSAANVTVTNPAPVIVLTSPPNGASYNLPATINLAASVTANGHTITKVQFYNGTALLGEDTAVPHTISWSNVSAGSYSVSARAVYDAGSTVSSAPVNITVTALPAPWQTADIGAVDVAGSAYETGGVYTVSGAGLIGGTADNFCFVYQSLSGDGEIQARINSPDNTGAGARIGVMVRESLTSGAKNACVNLSSDGMVRWQRRNSTGGNTWTGTASAAAPPNVWVRVVRAGRTLYGFKSDDGVNWTLLDSQKITMASNIYFGLAVASGSTGTPNIATFADVTVVP